MEDRGFKIKKNIKWRFARKKIDEKKGEDMELIDLMTDNVGLCILRTMTRCAFGLGHQWQQFGAKDPIGMGTIFVCKKCGHTKTVLTPN